MSRPYIPGVWAKKYESLPPERKDAVNREVNRVFVDRTGFTGKLDPHRDKALVRVWLRIRDAVMSGSAKALTRAFLRVDGFKGGSRDPRHRGWFDVVRTQFGATSMGASSNNVIVVVDGSKGTEGPILTLPLGDMVPSVVLQYSSPAAILTSTFERVLVSRMTDSRPHIEVQFTYFRVTFDAD